jgi:hypothetical protein
MSTTTLYAELVVVGTGAAIVILVFFYSLTGDWSLFSGLGGLASLGSAASLIPVLSIIYLLGIINTNIGFLLFKWFEDHLRSKAWPNNDNKYDEIRNKLYISNHKDLIDDFHFRRSKIRICRGWFINSFLIFVALIIGTSNGHVGSFRSRFSIATMGLLMIGTVVAFWAATDTELRELRFFDEDAVPESKG